MAVKGKATKKQRKAQQRAQGFLVNGDEFELGKVIGSGSFATVHLAVHVPTGKTWVIKRLDRARAEQEKQVECEIDILKKASNHPNIVAFHGWFRDHENVLCLVLGYCEGGSLETLTVQKGSTAAYFPEEQIMEWFVQMLSALAHLHEHHIIHRDIKPQNIFLSKSKKLIRLGDLGIAKQLEGTQDLATTMLGTPFYMSPELMTNRPYTYASDMWALGTTLYECAARHTAFAAPSMPQLVVKILRNAYQPLPSHFSRPFQQLVGMMLRADPEDRPTAAGLMMLPYVKATYSSMASKVAISQPLPLAKADVPPAQKPAARPSTAAGAGQAGTAPASATAARQCSRAQTPQSKARAPAAKRVPAAPGAMSDAKRKAAARAADSGAPRAASSGPRTASDPANHVLPGPNASGAGTAKTSSTAPNGAPGGGAAKNASIASNFSSGGCAAGNATVSSAAKRQAAVKPAKRASETVRAVSRSAKGKQWDDAINWELKMAARAERRIQAIELEKRQNRVDANRWKKCNDPAEQVRCDACGGEPAGTVI